MMKNKKKPQVKSSFRSQDINDSLFSLFPILWRHWGLEANLSIRSLLYELDVGAYNFRMNSPMDFKFGQKVNQIFLF